MVVPCWVGVRVKVIVFCAVLGVVPQREPCNAVMAFGVCWAVILQLFLAIRAVKLLYVSLIWALTVVCAKIANSKRG